MVSYKTHKQINKVFLLGPISFKKVIYGLLALRKWRIFKTAFGKKKDYTIPPKSTQCIKLSQWSHAFCPSPSLHAPVNWEKGHLAEQLTINLTFTQISAFFTTENLARHSKSKEALFEEIQYIFFSDFSQTGNFAGKIRRTKKQVSKWLNILYRKISPNCMII